MKCARCYEERELTHRVVSDILDMLVCDICSCQAYDMIEKQGGIDGIIRIEPVESGQKRLQ